jgi:hypothetical protein
MRRVIVALAFVLLATSAYADDRSGSLIVFPGSLSASVGTIGAAEAGNVVTTVRTEQSVALWRIGSALIGGTVVAGTSTDLDGYAWNRTQPYTVGAKVMTSTAIGVVHATAGVSGVRAAAGSGLAPALVVSYWNDWRPSAGIRFGKFFPGHLSATSGLITAAERGNWITNITFEQGATLWRTTGFDIIPYGSAGFAADTHGHQWNNRTLTDGGLKFRRAVFGGVADVRVAYRVDRNRQTDRVTAGPVVVTSFWLGWQPRYGR